MYTLFNVHSTTKCSQAHAVTVIVMENTTNSDIFKDSQGLESIHEMSGRAYGNTTTRPCK